MLVNLCNSRVRPSQVHITRKFVLSWQPVIQPATAERHRSHLRRSRGWQYLVDQTSDIGRALIIASLLPPTVELTVRRVPRPPITTYKPSATFPPSAPPCTLGQPLVS